MTSVEFIHQIQSKGHYHFCLDDAKKAFGKSAAGTLNALRRLLLKKLIVSPVKGFYLIVPPEYQAYGCLPADMFIPQLMAYLKLPYYVSFLSAAQYYGAAHQKPQRFQVVTIKNRRPIHCGRIFIEFISKKNIQTIPTRQFNTYTGTITVATPEALALDLTSSPRHAAGLNNIATIISELGEMINPVSLIKLNKANKNTAALQRLGFLCEKLELEKLANKVFGSLKEKKIFWTKLAPGASKEIFNKNKKWKIIENTQIEVDE